MATVTDMKRVHFAATSSVAADGTWLRRWVIGAGIALIVLIIAADCYEAWQDYHSAIALSEHIQVDSRTVLASWKEQELSSAARTFVLAMLCASLLIALQAALARRERLEQERQRLERELKESQRAEALGFLATSMAHDFNNVLSAIVGCAELARIQAGDDSPTIDIIDRLLAASERARQLVRRVLTFDPHRSVKRTPLSVGPIIAEVLELLKASLPPSVTLCTNDFGTNDSHGRILGDATEVHQVVMNLCSNAIRAMPAGGRLDVTLESLDVQYPRAMTLGELRPGGWLRLSIVDTGVGLTAEQVQPMFEPFYTTRPAGQGNGIGLTVVRRIVEKMGGAIEVDSQPSAGTRMSVYWPLVRDPCAPRHSDAVTTSAPVAGSEAGRGQSVLIVDDEPELVRLAEETVASLGYEAIGFVDARAALDAFQQAPARFDSVLTDQRMPALRGTALARAIHDLRADVPIILITGCREADTDNLAQQAGVMEILEKPLRAARLRDALSRALS